MCEMQRSAHTTSLTEADGMNLDNVGGGGGAFLFHTNHILHDCMLHN